MTLCFISKIVFNFIFNYELSSIEKILGHTVLNNAERTNI